MGSKGTSTTQNTSTTPNPEAMQQYLQLMQRAQGVSGTPYTPYGGELVAPVNPQQSLGIGNINANAGFAAPYINQATGLATSAATPISAADIQQYQSPYTQAVVQATQNQFNNQNAQQQQQLLGNAISRGSLGGNRTGIAQAELSNQQNLAQAPVIANLNNQGYSTALQTALAEQQAKQAGAYSLGNLGVAGQNAGLTGANAQIGAGTLQQQTQQAQNQAQYQQFLNQLAYPFQTTQWLAGIDSGIGGQMGGTSQGVTTPPHPSLLSQYGGAALGTAGILGGTGAFGASGWLAPALMALATGGSVPSEGVAGPAMGDPAPETDETLRAQQQQLLQGHRRAQMFPHGSNELPLPEGMGRVETDNGVFHYDPKALDENQIKSLSNSNRENELLDLGPFNKEDILNRVHNGEMPVAIVERTPEGVEVRAAAGTMKTIAQQIAAMERTKSPNNRVTVEDIRNVAAARKGRAYGGGVVRGFADGGVPELPPVPNMVGGMPWAGAKSWVPSMGMAPPKPLSNAQTSTQGVQPPQSLLQQAQQIGQLTKAIQGGFGSSPQSAPAQQDPEAEKSLFDASGKSDLEPSIGVVPGESRGGVVRGFADGGSPNDDSLNPRNWLGWQSGDQGGTFEPMSYAPTEPPSGQVAGVEPRASLQVSVRPHPQANPDVPAGVAPREVPPEGALRGVVNNSPPGRPEGRQGVDLGSDSKLWPSLAAAGFGMMSGTSPYAGVNIGQGALVGMQQHAQLKQQELAARKLTEELALRERLAKMPYEQMTAAQRAHSKLQETPFGWQKTATGIEPVPGGPHDPETIKRESEAKGELWVPFVDADGRSKMFNKKTMDVKDPSELSNPNSSQPTRAAVPGVQTVSLGQMGGVFLENSKLVESGEPYNYAQNAPYIEKGMEVPEPKPTVGKSVSSIKTDSEYYLQTGKLPPLARGASAVAVQQNNYRNAVQNYGNALASSRGMTPEQIADAWRTAPGMLKFVLGPDGRSTVSLGTAVRHLDTMRELAQAWAANDIQAINRLRAVVSREFGEAAATNLQAAGSIVGPEIIKAIGVAGAGTAEERLGAQRAFSTSVSPTQMLGAIETTQKLLGGQLEGRKRQALNAGVSEDRFKSLIGERPYEILSHIDKGAGSRPTLSAADQQALDWANANPNDPRAGKIKQRLGVP